MFVLCRQESCVPSLTTTPRCSLCIIGVCMAHSSVQHVHAANQDSASAHTSLQMALACCHPYCSELELRTAEIVRLKGLVEVLQGASAQPSNMPSQASLPGIKERARVPLQQGQQGPGLSQQGPGVSQQGPGPSDSRAGSGDGGKAAPHPASVTPEGVGKQTALPGLREGQIDPVADEAWQPWGDDDLT